MYDISLSEMSTICDLWVIFQPNLSFTSHIENIISKVLRTHGYVIPKNCITLNLIFACLKFLNCTLVRPIVEYDSL